MAAIVRASHALSFELLNRDRHPILGIFDGQQGQSLKLEITNSSRRELKPKTLTGTEPTAENHHFELKFRPGTLNLTGMPAIAVDKDDVKWRVSKPVETKDGVSFYLLTTDSTPVPIDKKIAVTLNNFSGDGKRGAHGTRVELKWKDGSLEYLASAGQTPEPLVAGYRMQHLSIVNESGQKHIPLFVGIVGNNKVLNDGVNETTLTMRIANLLKDGSIQLNPKSADPNLPPGSVFTISFDSGSENDAWALAKLDHVKAIAIKANPLKSVEFGFDPPSQQGQSVMWSMSPKAAVSLGPLEFIELTISKIVTTLPSGQTQAHVHYKNIPGYWDGDFVSAIEKAPLVYKEEIVAGKKEQRVGVGTSKPEAKFDVAGKARIAELLVTGTATVDKLTVSGLATADKLTVGQNITCDKLRVEKDVSVGGSGLFDVDAPMKPGGRFKVTADGNVGIGVMTPEAHLHVAGAGDQQIMIQSTDANGVKWSLQSSEAATAGRFEIVNRNVNLSRFTILKDGNVGIGTVAPGTCTNEGNYFKIDKDGRILEVHSPQHESVLILSSAQNSDGAHLGGMYFIRTTGQPDAHREVAAIKCRQAGSGILGGGVLQFFTKPNGGGANFDNPRMVILENGNIGIGTKAPSKGALEVARTVAAEAIAGYRFMNIHVTDNDHRRQTRDYSIWATGRCAAEEFNAVSDERIKSIHGRSDGAADLCTLLGIEITDYSFRDVISKGNGVHKKVIGQQVEKVFPQAVNRQTEVVPDIYEQALVQDGWVLLATDLKSGERVKLITEKGGDVYEVLEVTPNKFRVDLEPEVEKVFVFGREVDDLLTVDYDAISMLNVSATQQLKKEMDHLRAENAELRAANNALAKRLQLIESKLGVAVATNGSNGNGRH